LTGKQPRSKASLGAAAVLAWSVVAVLAVPLAAQDLPLKTAPPSGADLLCAGGAWGTVELAGAPRERPEAGRLTNAATQAMILGDLDGALEFLDRALRIEPTATEAVYLRARILEQQGAMEAAAEAFCEYLRLEPTGPSAQEVRRRLDAARDLDVGRRLLDTYRRALALEFEGRLEEAEAAFTEVVSARPAAALALYNRGVVRAVLGRTEDARDDFRRYLELEPGAGDAPAVRSYMARLADAQFVNDRSGVRAGTALFMGALLPGGGQFYTGRPVLGATVTALAIGALATGALYQRTTVHCLDAAADPCPQEMVASRETGRPLLTPMIGVAVGLALVAAVEAALHAGRHSHLPDTTAAGMIGAATSATIDRISYDASALRLELVRWQF
jgi:tetratricopeptide (TPR) repeat protein